MSDQAEHRRTCLVTENPRVRSDLRNHLYPGGLGKTKLGTFCFRSDDTSPARRATSSPCRWPRSTGSRTAAAALALGRSSRPHHRRHPRRRRYPRRRRARCAARSSAECRVWCASACVRHSHRALLLRRAWHTCVVGVRICESARCRRVSSIVCERVMLLLISPSRACGYRYVTAF